MSYQILGKTGQMNMSRPGCLLGFALIWLGFSSIFLVIGLTSQAGIFFLLFSLLFVGIGVALLIFSLLSYFARYKVGQPDFRLTQTTLRVGDPFNFTFSHTFPRSVEISEMRTELVFRERATYQQGTDTTTVTHDHIVQSFKEPGRKFQAGQILAKAYELRIPPEAMHTLKVRRNELTWLLKFEAEIPKLPNFVEEFELTVLPEMSQQESDG